MGNISSQIEPEYHATVSVNHSDDKIEGKFIVNNISNKSLENNNQNQNQTINKEKFILGIIDVQNDFFKNGSLAVTDAESILGPINKLRYLLPKHIDTFVSQDYHSPNHMSFATTHNATQFEKKNLSLEMPDKTFLNITQDMWPRHCVKDTLGVQFHDDLILTHKDKIFKKGTLTNVESYSAFGDEFNAKYENTGLNVWLKEKGITDIILVGVATDFCVYNTALDAIELGYNVHLILSCTRGVGVKTTEDALKDMKTKKVVFYKTIDEFVRKNNFLFV